MTPPDAFATAARRSLADPGSLRARLAAVRTERSVRTLNDWVEEVRVDSAQTWLRPALGGHELSVQLAVGVSPFAEA
ncbi:hypothetical protein, partial [Streptomyces sp. NPDC047966]|uniref:hypothetical protein n=1 Tax=Streptomyces sp. NPDC047966 TaxID=3155745 RepID=UPI00343B77A1